MHLAIEGMDGVGKTTAARTLAARLGFRLIEKPLQFLLDEPGDQRNYLRVRDRINLLKEDDALRAWFYGLGNLYLMNRFRGEDIITDRHLASNYHWCGGPETERLFACLVELTGKPDHTFLLRASNEEALRRIRSRNPADPDLHKADLHSIAAEKMHEFLVRYDMPHTVIDTTCLDQAEVVDAIMRVLPPELGARGAA